MNSSKSQIDKTPEWKVVRILDEYRIVVNAPIGTVKEGDRLQVYRDTTVISDPETHEELGILPDVLATVEVVQTEDRLCVAESAEFTIVSPLAESMAEYARTLRSAMHQSLWLGQSERQMLPVQPEDIERPKQPRRERSIRVGDKVRKAPQPPKP
jgi:hypothetical protein